MPFRSSILGGIGTLIRTYIRSPNYVAGMSGWTINKDGSVEFNNGTFRGTLILTSAGVALLVYNGAPAAGNLILAIANTTGQDTFGNNYYPGLRIYPTASLLNGFQLRSDPTQNDAGNDILTIGITRIGVDTGTAEILYTPNVHAKPLVINADGLSPGITLAGTVTGKAYGSDNTWTAAGVVTNTVTHITNLVTSETGAYGSAFTGGTFTAPVDGYYLGTLLVDSPVSTTLRAIIRANGVSSPPWAFDTDTAADCTVTAGGHLNAGDTLDFYCYQNSGANQNLSGRLSVVRLTS